MNYEGAAFVDYRVGRAYFWRIVDNKSDFILQVMEEDWEKVIHEIEKIIVRDCSLYMKFEDRWKCLSFYVKKI